jgi:hypothetical protein
MRPRSERQRQEDRARRARRVVRWGFRLDDGSLFDAVASCKYGALHVLNSERPGHRAKLEYTCDATLQA